MKRNLFYFFFVYSIIFLLNAKNSFGIKTSLNNSFGNLYLSINNTPKKGNGKFFVPSYSTHYIAPAPWQYWNKANEIVITTFNTATVQGKIYKSDGTFITDFLSNINAPFSYRFDGLPKNTPVLPLNTVVDAAGLIIVADASISVNLRNVASDNLGGDGNDSQIKGNASLFSFGDAAIGSSFRVGYYRNGPVSGTENPIYTVMAIDDNTIVKINGIATATLNKGQSYLFNAPMGTLVETSGLAVMNTSARLDVPGACGDGAFNPIPPIASLGSEYAVVRGEGNLIAEQTTVVALEDNTSVVVKNFDENGIEKSQKTYTLAKAGDFVTFNHGYINGTYSTTSNTGRYSSSHIKATKNIEVFSGTAGISGGGGCEVDVATLVPIEPCSGSRRVETLKFTSYTNTDLPYFGYLITKSDDKIYLTTKGGSANYEDRDIETIPGISVRKALAGTGLSLIKFTNLNIGSPKVITITSNTRITASIVQQSSDFSMSNFISRFSEKAILPSMSQTECDEALLKASAESSAPYQWYLNGVKIDGATESSYLAKKSGNYSLSSQLECGMSAQSLPLTVSICNIDRAVTKTVDIEYPELNTNVVFTIKASNLGDGLTTGVSVVDLLPAGFQYVSNVAPAGTSYNATTGIWSIGDIAAKGVFTLTIEAKVVLLGTNINKAIIAGNQKDNNSVNDESSVTTITGSFDRELCIGTAIDPIKIPLTNNRGLSVSGLPNGLTYVYDNDNKQVIISGTPNVTGNFTYKVLTTGAFPINKQGLIKVNNNVGIPVFESDLTDSRCMASGTDIYKANATNATKIEYSILPFSAGSINSSTGEVTWLPTFYGTATITAKAIGCAEKTNDFSVKVNPLPNVLFAQTDVCEGATSFDLHYTEAENNPISYSVQWEGNQFPAETNKTLTPVSIPINIPANAAIGNYKGTVTLLNDQGCSNQINFNVNIITRPNAPHVQLITNSEY